VGEDRCDLAEDISNRCRKIGSLSRLTTANKGRGRGPGETRPVRSGARVLVDEGTAPVRISAHREQGAIVAEVARDTKRRWPRSSLASPLPARGRPAGPRGHYLVSDRRGSGYGRRAPRHGMRDPTRSSPSSTGPVGAGIVVPAPILGFIPFGSVGRGGGGRGATTASRPRVRGGLVLAAVEPLDADCVPAVGGDWPSATRPFQRPHHS